jgi:predicted DNA-binding transcriptional regulator YafY
MRDTSQRRQQIGRMLKERGSVQVADLAQQYNVSTVTIRKDLRFLGYYLSAQTTPAKWVHQAEKILVDWRLNRLWQSPLL